MTSPSSTTSATTGAFTGLRYPELDPAAACGMSIAFWAERAPERPALLSEHGQRSFGELNARANRVARLLRAQGLGHGDGVALLCANRPEFADVHFGCQRAGVRMTPINWHLGNDEIAYVVDDCGAKVLFADARFAPAALAARAAAPGLERVVALAGAIEGFETLDAALAPHASDDLEEPRLGDVMLYTSGTTGRPKGVQRPMPEGERAVLGMKMLSGVFGFRMPSLDAQPGTGAGDVTLGTGPLYHSGPINLCLGIPLSHGIPTVLMDRWTPESMLRLIEEHRVTHTYCVPTMFRRLLALPAAVRAKADPSSLRFVIHGAAPCPVEDKRAIIEWLGPIVTELYAATEGMGTLVSSEEWLAKPGTVGKPMPGTVRIVGERGEPLPQGETGTVYLHPLSGADFEYRGASDKTSEARREGGFTVGDMGYVDADGYLFLTGRSAEIVIVGGANVYPAEIDGPLMAHPDVVDAAAFGARDPEWGEVVHAAVVAGAGVEVDSDALVAWYRERLPGLQAPRVVHVVDEIPRSEAGKIFRRKLVERFAGSS